MTRASLHTSWAVAVLGVVVSKLTWDAPLLLDDGDEIAFLVNLSFGPMPDAAAGASSAWFLLHFLRQ